jgi:hypothetical protein
MKANKMHITVSIHFNIMGMNGSLKSLRLVGSYES